MADARTYLSARIARGRPDRVAIADILNAAPVMADSADTVRAVVARRRVFAMEARP